MCTSNQQQNNNRANMNQNNQQPNMYPNLSQFFADNMASTGNQEQAAQAPMIQLLQPLLRVVTKKPK